MSDASFEALAGLLQHCEVVSRRMLAEAGEFYPFGAFVSPEGEVRALAADIGEKRPRPAELYEFLHGAVTQMAKDGTALGYAVAANVVVPKQFNSPYPDAVRVHVETVGYSRDIFTPYRFLPLRALRRFLVVLPVVQYAEPIAVDTPAQSFPS